jgi:hypothetical protein
MGAGAKMVLLCGVLVGLLCPLACRREGEPKAAEVHERSREPTPLSGTAAGRTLYFPPDRAVGLVELRDQGCSEEKAWRDFALARGAVHIPPGQEVSLVVAGEEATPLSFLKSFRADDLLRLELCGQQFGDETLVDVQALHLLRQLDLSASRVSNGGLLRLAKISGLEALSLSFTKVSDAGLEYLVPLLALKRLDLVGTNVTSGGVSALKKALPSCAIKWE